MKKVGIITLCSNDNYGNKLQNYALKKSIEKMSFEVNTIWIDNAFESKNMKAFLKYIKNKLKDCFFEHKRKRIFKEFNRKYLNIFDKHVIFNNDLHKMDKSFNYFVVGSDQVWNYNFMNNFKTYFMMNILKEKCFSYAASIGVNSIPSRYIKQYEDGIQHLNYISVREVKAKQIINQVFERTDVQVLVDPTMLLTAEEWDKISRKPEQLKTDRYILNYFLGDLSEERKKEIDRIAKENNCEVINMLDKNSSFYQTGPSEFLHLEKNAFLVCTDSFHSSVFAIIYNRPFIVFEREQKSLESMNSRIETLINKFNLKNRKFTGRITEENLRHNYTEAYEILEKERQKSNEFLKKALDIKE